MIDVVTSKIEELIKESEKENGKISVDDYTLTSADAILSSYEYELSVSEEGLLDFIYQADHLQFSSETASIIKNKVSIAEQKSFFTKLFIYETLAEHETSFVLPYDEYITTLNTGFSDGIQKTVSDLVEIYASDELKKDKKFNSTIKKLKKCKIDCDSNYDVGYQKIKGHVK